MTDPAGKHTVAYGTDLIDTLVDAIPDEALSAAAAGSATARKARIARAVLDALVEHGALRLALDDRTSPQSTWFRSCTPDGEVWCEDGDPDDVVRMSAEVNGCTYHRYDIYQVTSGWQPWPEGAARAAKRAAEVARAGAEQADTTNTTHSDQKMA